MKNIKYLLSFSLFFLLLPACLLTHQDIQKHSAKGANKGAQSSQDPSPLNPEGVMIVNAEGGQSGVSTAEAQSTPAFANKQSALSLAMEKIAFMENQIRELRGQIELKDKEREQQIAQIEQNLVSFIQALDLRVTALTENMPNKAQPSSATQKTSKSKTAAQNTLLARANKFFQENKWKQAIINYEKYRTKYRKKGQKKGVSYRKATLNIGICFQKLNMEKEAKVFFRELVNDFPKSLEAKKAKALLAPAKKKKPSAESSVEQKKAKPTAEPSAKKPAESAEPKKALPPASQSATPSLDTKSSASQKPANAEPQKKQ